MRTFVIAGFIVAGVLLVCDAVLFFDEMPTAEHGMQARTLLEAAVGFEEESSYRRLLQLVAGLVLPFTPGFWTKYTTWRRSNAAPTSPA